MKLRTILTLLVFKAATIGCSAQKTVPKTDFEKAYHFYSARDFRSALNVFNGTAEKDGERYAASLVIMGFVLNDSISFDAGKPFFEKAEGLLINAKELKLKAKNYFGLGRGYFNKAEFPQSISYFLKMLEITEKEKFIPEQKSACYYLAMDYQRLNKIAISNEYIKRAIEMAKEMNDSGSVVRCYYVYGTNQTFHEGNDSVVNEYGDSILQIVREAEKYDNGKNRGQHGMIDDMYTKAYDMKRDPVNCTKHAFASLQDYLATADSQNIIGCYIILGESYLQLKKYDSALYFSKIAEGIKSRNQGLISSDQRAFYYTVYQIYKGLEKHDLALSYLEKWYAQDLELNEEKNVNLQQLRENFETQKTEQRIANENERTKALFEQKRNFYSYIFLSLLLALLLLAYLVYYRIITKKKKEQSDLRLQMQHAELTALKAQMNPHFIFNALNSIQHSIVSNNTEDAYRFLAKFSRLIRSVLDNSSETLIALGTEIETLSLYMEIESRRFDHSFSFEMSTISNGFDPEKILVPSMIIQPFIENAIWHGLMPKEGDKHLRVLFTIVTMSTIICEISDNGIGREKAGMIAAKKNAHRSKGISNIMDRIKLLKKTHGVSVDIDICDEKQNNLPAGTKVTLTITNKGEE